MSHHFVKDEIDLFPGMKYDYSSIMHSGRFAYSKYETIDDDWGSDRYSIIPFVSRIFFY